MISFLFYWSIYGWYIKYCFINNPMVAWCSAWGYVSRTTYYKSAQRIAMGNSFIYYLWGIVFFSFFWAFFHRRLSPSPELGRIWPPVGIQPFNPFNIPLLNTAILLASGATVTWAHHRLIHSEHSEAIFRLLVTISLGVYFTALQAFEYIEASFSIADSVYGSTFFVATGFHGLHVLIGTTFLLVCFFRLAKAHFSPDHHFGFEAAAWYWHFVDVVWLFLYISIYWWGGYLNSI